MSQQQWVCLETRETLNDPGVDNGILETWINGVPTLRKTGQRMRASGDNGQYVSIRLYNQNGLGVIYWDDFAGGDTIWVHCEVARQAASHQLSG